MLSRIDSFAREERLSAVGSGGRTLLQAENVTARRHNAPKCPSRHAKRPGDSGGNLWSRFRMRLEGKAGLHILKLKVWQLAHDFFRREACPPQVQHVGNPDAHAAKAWLAAALGGILGDAFHAVSVLDSEGKGTVEPPQI